MPSRNAQEHFCVGRIALRCGINRCIDHVRNWMLNDKLKLNDDKTEFVIIGPLQQLAKVSQILTLCAGSIVQGNPLKALRLTKLEQIIPKSVLKFARAHTKVGFPTEYLLEVVKAVRITIPADGQLNLD